MLASHGPPGKHPVPLRNAESHRSRATGSSPKAYPEVGTKRTGICAEVAEGLLRKLLDSS